MHWFDSESSAPTALGAPAMVAPAEVSSRAKLDQIRGTSIDFGGQVGAGAPSAPPLDLGPLATLVDADTTDLLVNGPGSIWTDSPKGLRRVANPPPLDEETVRELAARLVSDGGRHLDHANPCVDARLPGGVRVHAVIPPVSVGGTTLSVRFPRRNGLSLADLIESGSIAAHDAERLTTLVGQRANILVTGASGAGKTTLLAALLAGAGAHERIVTVEDVAELRVDHPHVVSLEARQANTEGVGEIGLAELVRQALRMRPDRLVVGECRGAEVREMLAALGSGHDGGASTLHARSLDEVGVRLETLGALAGLEGGALARMVTCAIDVVVHVERVGASRRIAAIGRPVRRHDEISVEPLA